MEKEYKITITVYNANSTKTYNFIIKSETLASVENLSLSALGYTPAEYSINISEVI